MSRLPHLGVAAAATASPRPGGSFRWGAEDVVPAEEAGEDRGGSLQPEPAAEAALGAGPALHCWGN